MVKWRRKRTGGSIKCKAANWKIIGTGHVVPYHQGKQIWWMVTGIFEGIVDVIRLILLLYFLKYYTSKIKILLRFCLVEKKMGRKEIKFWNRVNFCERKFHLFLFFFFSFPFLCYQARGKGWTVVPWNFSG